MTTDRLNEWFRHNWAAVAAIGFGVFLIGVSSLLNSDHPLPIIGNALVAVGGIVITVSGFVSRQKR